MPITRIRRFPPILPCLENTASEEIEDESTNDSRDSVHSTDPSPPSEHPAAPMKFRSDNFNSPDPPSRSISAAGLRGGGRMLLRPQSEQGVSDEKTSRRDDSPIVVHVVQVGPSPSPPLLPRSPSQPVAGSDAAVPRVPSFLSSVAAAARLSAEVVGRRRIERGRQATPDGHS